MTEVMSTFDFNQEQPNQSLDTCGFAATALCFAAGPLGSAPRHTVQWAIQQMASWYTAYDGPDIRSNTNGMETWQLYKLIVEKGGHFQAIDPNASSIASWIGAKYPVIVAVTEDSVYDVHLKAKPYTWDTSGLSHIFTVTGIDHDHIFLVRDTVNQHDGSPYSYDGDKLSYLSATVFVPDWLPRPTSAIAPHAVAPSGVPANWKDDGHSLYGPHGEGPLVLGFRDFVLANHWNPGDPPLVPQYYTQQLEVSNPDLGDGDQVIFLHGTVLGYPHNPKDVGLKHKVIVEYAGKELVALRQQVLKYYTLAKDMHDRAAQLEADLQAFQKVAPQP